MRLAAKLTGWRIDIRTDKQYAEEQAKKMFDVDAPAAARVTRESPDALAGIFPTAPDDPDAHPDDDDARWLPAPGDMPGPGESLIVAATRGGLARRCLDRRRLRRRVRR